MTPAEIRDLVDRLNRYRDSYYNRNESLVSDCEYDKLFDQLVEAESESGCIYSDSPTQNVGFEVKSKLTKVKHSHPLLSMGKTTDVAKFEEFFGDRKFCLMPKLDGLTISLKYSGGQLVMAETRGDGQIGEDITHNAKQFVNIPLTINYPGDLTVDGEAIIDRNTFAEINQDGEYKNPRNLVSGTVRQLDSSIVAKRKVKFIAWKLWTEDPRAFGTSHYLKQLFLADLGFEITTTIQLTPGKFQMETQIERMKEIAKVNAWPIDGLVGIFDDTEYGRSLGMTGHHPRENLAFKFEQEPNESTILNIEWQTTRSGKINPVAIVEPVDIDGSTVSRASLTNVSIIKKLEIGLGDTVHIIKANQIIPQIIENITRSGSYKFPNECPACGAEAKIVSTGGAEILVCQNPYCKGKLIDKLDNFGSRQGLNIIGLSGKRLEAMVESGLVKDFHDLYLLDATSKWPEGFGEKTIENLLRSIETSKNTSFANFLVAIGIPGIGKSAAKDISKHCAQKSNGDIFATFIDLCDKFYSWDIIDDIGESTSFEIHGYITSNMDELLQLQKVGFIFEEDNAAATTGNSLAGKIFCVTGKLEHYKSRDELVKEIESFGGAVSSGVSKKTNYLICNDVESGSSKVKNAEKYKVQIINELEFRTMIEGGANVT